MKIKSIHIFRQMRTLCGIIVAICAIMTSIFQNQWTNVMVSVEEYSMSQIILYASLNYLFVDICEWILRFPIVFMFNVYTRCQLQELILNVGTILPDNITESIDTTNTYMADIVTYKTFYLFKIYFLIKLLFMWYYTGTYLSVIFIIIVSIVLYLVYKMVPNWKNCPKNNNNTIVTCNNTFESSIGISMKKNIQIWSIYYFKKNIIKTELVFFVVNSLGLVCGSIISNGSISTMVSISTVMHSVVSIIFKLNDIESASDNVSQYNNLIEFLKKHQYVSTNIITHLSEIKTIEFVNVYFKYPQSDDYVLKNLSFSMKQGVYFLRAPNGTGKTSLIKALISNIDSGTIYINGNNKTDITKECLLRNVFYLPQPSEFSPNITGHQIATYTQNEIMIDIFGIRDIIYHKNGTINLSLKTRHLSGGQKQRIHAYIALISDCPIVLLDESFGEINKSDKENSDRDRIIKYINDNVKNKIVICVYHDVNMNGLKYIDIEQHNGETLFKYSS